ncbi:MAG TPA: folate-binding protein [Sphingomicrobium sp.]|jgi:folate-binding protein YgfZ|nr:folate-binding protein [Sphingomicrobium sp.]
MAATTQLSTTLADRAVLRVSGEDVRGFLQGLVTSDVAGALPVWAGLLTPQGKCLFDFILWEDGDDLLLDCEGGAADDLIRRLSIYRLRRPIVIGRDSTLTVHWSADGREGVPDPRLAALGRRWLQPRTPAGAGPERDESGLLSTQENKWLEHRLRLGVCEGRSELGDLLWLECNAAELNGVSFTKGCFVGQENTARMNWRQKINRRLFVVRGGGGERSRAEYPGIGLSVVHARVDAIPDDAVVPEWLRPALSAPAD